ncbi:MAG: histidine--tRNA ligase [Acidobacteriota bacterium]
MSRKEKGLSSIKGTKDILPAEARKWQWVEKVSKEHFERYGYREIRTPVFEATELFEKGTGETSDIVIKEMYTFTDKGGRSLALRPEYTPSVVRAIIEHRLYLKTPPLRYYYIGPMFRYDKPQKGRYRQFHQVDIEVFDERDPAVDAEIVEMADSLLKKLEVKNTEILVNSVGCPGCRVAYQEDLRQAARESKGKLCSECRRKIETNPLRIFDCKEQECRQVSQGFPKITEYLCQDCQRHFEKFQEYLNLYGLSYKVAPRLVRGLDYYTKTTFEIVTSELGAQDAVLGGGRYDDMMKTFGGPDICGIGFAMGLERLLALVPFATRETPFLYLVYMNEETKRVSVDFARRFRQMGVECLLEFKGRSLKNSMSRANKLGARWALIIGEEELRRECFNLKDMKSGKQKALSRDELLKYFSQFSSRK